MNAILEKFFKLENAVIELLNDRRGHIVNTSPAIGQSTCLACHLKSGNVLQDGWDEELGRCLEEHGVSLKALVQQIPFRRKPFNIVKGKFTFCRSQCATVDDVLRAAAEQLTA